MGPETLKDAVTFTSAEDRLAFSVRDDGVTQ